MIDETGSLTPLAPAYPLDGEETLVWEGDGVLSSSGQTELTQVLVRWDPATELLFRQPDADSDELAAFQAFEPQTTLRLEGFDEEIPVLLRSHAPASGRIAHLSWGDAGRVRKVRFHLTNFPNVLLPLSLHQKDADGERYWRGSMLAEGGRWELRLDARPELKDLATAIEERQTFAVTHIGQLSRRDGETFSSDEIDSALRCLLALFSFGRGAWSAPMLPVGFDDRSARVWWNAGSVFCTAGLVRGLSWLDSHDGDGFQQVAGQWMDLWEEPQWRVALDRAVMYYTEANRQGVGHPSFLEIRYTLAQAGLELMAWTILKQEASEERPAWVKGPGAAPTNLRNLLMWAGIPQEVPPELPALEALKQDHGWDDAAHVPSWLRNQIAHPKPRPEAAGPAHDVLWQGTQLAVWYLELLLLRRLGFNGRYGCRLETERWAGQTRPVPWAEKAQ